MDSRSRRSARSKNGCLRCREKHLKCDETQPGCLECRKRKIRCPGYRQELRWSSKYEVFRPSSVDDASQERLTSPRTEQKSLRQSINLTSGDSIDNSASTADSSSNDQDTPPLRRHGSRRTATGPSDKFCPGESRADFGGAPSNEQRGRAVDGITTDDVPDRPTGERSISMSNEDDVELSTLNSSIDKQQPVPNQPLSIGSMSSELLQTQQGSDFQRRVPVEHDKLLDHYFEQLCRRNSAFDSATNPFRYVISKYVRESPLILNCVLSMTARSLVQRREDLLPNAVGYHTAAVTHLFDTLDSIGGTNVVEDEWRDHGSQPDLLTQIKQALLATILLGISSSWLDTSDLGMQHLLGARRLLAKWQTMFPSGAFPPMLDPETSFLVGALAYWESLLAFIIDQPLTAVDYLLPFCDQSKLEVIHLHPWTGVCMPLFVSLAKVGILARQKRLSASMAAMGWNRSTRNVRQNLLNAATLVEQEILAFEVPPRSKTGDTGDPTISISHLENFAVTYRLASMLELYRCFPELLAQQVRSLYATDPDNQTRNEGTVEGIQQSSSLSTTQSKEEVFATGGAAKHFHINMLQQMATATISSTERIPHGTGLSLLHTLAMLIAGSVLYSVPTTCQPIYRTAYSTQNISCPSPTPFSVLLSITTSRTNIMNEHRQLLRQRARSNAQSTGLKSFKQAEQLLESIWAKLDNIAASYTTSNVEKADGFGRVGGINQNADGNDDPLAVHWLDVMADCSLETVYG